MLNNRLLVRTARKISRGGFTLVELLVVIGIIAILAGVALGPITRAIKQAQESASIQTTRQIGLMEFAYSNDNSQTYPYGAASSGGSETIANLLLNSSYSTDPTVFYIKSTPGSVAPVSSTPYTQTTKFVAYDFMVNNTAGLTSAASDGTPLVQLTGMTGPSTLSTTGPIAATITAANAAFGTDGIAVSYKSNSAKFLKGTVTSSTQSTISTYVDSSYNDSSAAGYQLTKP